MNQRAFVAAAAATLLTTLMAAAPASAQDMSKDAKAKEKCYGIAKAGQNDCANLTGTHSCAGQAKVSDHPTEWKYVAKGTCASMKGMTAEEAKAKSKA